MTSVERLALIRTKVERAKEHFSNLESEIVRFLDGNDPGPYGIGTKEDSQTRELLYYILSVSAVPSRISVLAGDALQNCRTALDHLAYQFFLVGNPGSVPSRQISFPIFNDAPTYYAEKFRKVQGMRKDAIDFFDAIKPYKGGNDLLWRLHRLNNIDKHRLLLAAVIGVQGRSLTEIERTDLRTKYGAASEKVRFFAPGRDRWAAEWNRPLKAGDVFHTAPPDSEVDKNMKLAVEVTLEEPEVVERKSLTETVDEIRRFVDGLISSCQSLLT